MSSFLSLAVLICVFNKFLASCARANVISFCLTKNDDIKGKRDTHQDIFMILLLHIFNNKSMKGCFCILSAVINNPLVLIINYYVHFYLLMHLQQNTSFINKGYFQKIKNI